MNKSFQLRCYEWIIACFNAEIAADKIERRNRFFEETVELYQACGGNRLEAYKLVDYVYGRQIGEVFQEIGGVLNTLALLCSACEIDMEEAGETELAECWNKIEKVRAKRANKPEFGALPISDVKDKPDWQFYRDGVLQSVTEDEMRQMFSSWRYFSCDRGQASVLIEQLWDEIDRLRRELQVFNEVAAEVVNAKDEFILTKLLAFSKLGEAKIKELQAENNQLKQAMFGLDNTVNIIRQTEDKFILDEIKRRLNSESKSS